MVYGYRETPSSSLFRPVRTQQLLRVTYKNSELSDHSAVEGK